MITIDFTKRGSKTLCDFLIETIKNQISNGELKPKEKLPSKRNLAQHLGISVITVQNAYAQLIDEGYIYSIEKTGFFVTDLKPLAVKSETFEIKENIVEKNNNLLADFKSNSSAVEKFPFTLWAKTMREVLNTSEEKLLERTDVKGVYELRKAIAMHLNGFRNMKVHPQQIIIGAGTESLYSMLVQFFGETNIFAVENPGYSKVFKVINQNGARCVPINTDKSGIKIQDLKYSGARVVHVSPSHNFPTGIVMPIKRRQELLEWAYEKNNRFIIEDDYDSEFRFSGKPLPSLQSSDTASKVIYMNTFSKTLSPSFRICYMILPVKLIKPFEEKFNFYSCQVSSFEQYTLAKFIENGNFEKHINRMKNYYRTLRNELIHAIKTSRFANIAEIQEEDSGLHFLLTVKTNKTSEELRNELERRQVSLSLLSDFYAKGTKGTGINNNTKGTGTNVSTTFVINYSALKKEKLPQIIKEMEEAFLN